MRCRLHLLSAILMPIAAIAIPSLTCPAMAAVDNQDAGRFVKSLTDEAFVTLRTGERQAARSKFRSLLAQYFAVDQIGDRLIARWRPQISPAQYGAYKAALPGFLIGTYADRLYDYAHADIKVVRVVPRGADAVVQSQVMQPGRNPINAVWTVTRIGDGYKVSNLIVSGINLTLTQTADFNSYIQRNGFDKLVAFMKSRG